MRIIAGAWRGRVLAAPPGHATRPTADRVRQSLFDSLLHAPWGGRALLEGALVLDAFAGTGALGLEALSRGAARAIFFERDRVALSVLRENIARCGAGDRSQVVAGDVLRPPRGTNQNLLFMDPPYDQGLIPLAADALRQAHWIAQGTIIVAECGRCELVPDQGLLRMRRIHGAAQIVIWQEQ